MGGERVTNLRANRLLPGRGVIAAPLTEDWRHLLLRMTILQCSGMQGRAIAGLPRRCSIYEIALLLVGVLWMLRAFKWGEYIQYILLYRRYMRNIIPSRELRRWRSGGECELYIYAAPRSPMRRLLQFQGPATGEIDQNDLPQFNISEIRVAESPGRSPEVASVPLPYRQAEGFRVFLFLEGWALYFVYIISVKLYMGNILRRGRNYFDGGKGGRGRIIFPRCPFRADGSYFGVFSRKLGGLTNHNSTFREQGKGASVYPPAASIILARRQIDHDTPIHDTGACKGDAIAHYIRDRAPPIKGGIFTEFRVDYATNSP